MASSSAPASVFDDYHFMEELNQTLFESSIRRKKIIPKVAFNLEEDEYPQIKEQIALRGWRRLAAPTTEIRMLLLQEVANAGVMRFKAETEGAETDYRTRQATDQRLDEVLAELCIPGSNLEVEL
ncbi:hypothetical protein PIB30_064211 [Stylosanthes scabra]|uniref:Uncharacterized protein n=1 Tax=Stylosanthes scabra TaxID=79078 RepID=A0ABU6WPG4_9FABA|nr:hypothetical protein [Stylosanthes scabra]